MSVSKTITKTVREKQLEESNALLGLIGGGLVLGAQAIYNKWKNSKSFRDPHGDYAYHGPSKTYYGKSFKPANEKAFFKHLTHERMMDPVKAQDMITRLKAPHENNEHIQKHMKLANLYRDAAEKSVAKKRAVKDAQAVMDREEGTKAKISMHVHTARKTRKAARALTHMNVKNPKTGKVSSKQVRRDKVMKNMLKDEVSAIMAKRKEKAKAYRKAAEFHMKKARRLKQGLDKTWEEDFAPMVRDMLLEGFSQDEIISIFDDGLDLNEEELLMVKTEIDKEDKKDKEEPKEPDTSVYHVPSDTRMTDTTSLMTEDYIYSVVDDLAKVFMEEEIVSILAGDFDDYHLRLHKWGKSGNLRVQRLQNAKNAIAEGYLDGYAEWLEEQLLPGKGVGSVPDPRLNKSKSPIAKNRSLVPQSRALYWSTPASQPAAKKAAGPGLFRGVKNQYNSIRNNVRSFLGGRKQLQKKLGAQAYRKGQDAESNLHQAKAIDSTLASHARNVPQHGDATQKVGMAALNAIKAGGNKKSIGKSVAAAHADHETNVRVQTGVHAGVASALSRERDSAFSKAKQNVAASSRYGKLARDKNARLPWKNAFRGEDIEKQANDDFLHLLENGFTYDEAVQLIEQQYEDEFIKKKQS